MFGGNPEGGFNELLQELQKSRGYKWQLCGRSSIVGQFFFQNTLFHGESIEVVKEEDHIENALRTKDISTVKKVKDEGTSAFQDLDFNTACKI